MSKQRCWELNGRVIACLLVTITWPCAVVAQPLGDKAERLARDQAILQAELERMSQGSAAQVILQEVITRLEATDPSERWVKTRRGWIARSEIDFYRYWNSPADDAARSATAEDAAAKARPARAVDFDNPRHPFHCIVDFAKQLKAHDIDLLVVPVPNRLHYHPKLIVRSRSGKRVAGMAPGLTAFMLALSRVGVEVVPLLPDLVDQRVGKGSDQSVEMFLQANTHWTPAGAALVAAKIAQRIGEYEWYEPGQARENKEFRVVRSRFQWEPRSSAGPSATDSPQVLDFESVELADGSRVGRDRDSPILILGDSFCQIFLIHGADFPSQLYRKTGIVADVIASGGGAARASRAALKRRLEPFRGKRLVIWIFGARILGAESDWKLINFFE